MGLYKYGPNTGISVSTFVSLCHVSLQVITQWILKKVVFSFKENLPFFFTCWGSKIQDGIQNGHRWTTFQYFHYYASYHHIYKFRFLVSRISKEMILWNWKVSYDLHSKFEAIWRSNKYVLCNHAHKRLSQPKYTNLLHISD